MPSLGKGPSLYAPIAGIVALVAFGQISDRLRAETSNWSKTTSVDPRLGIALGLELPVPGQSSRATQLLTFGNEALYRITLCNMAHGLASLGFRI
jgi:hypothetical protein